MGGVLIFILMLIVVGLLLASSERFERERNQLTAGGTSAVSASPERVARARQFSATRSGANLLWFFLGGGLIGLGWYIVGVAAAISIVGIPWARACFVLGTFTLVPFGREAISRADLGQRDVGTGTLGFVGNIIWFVFGGLVLAISHAAAALLCAITVIGIPFALQHVKLAGIALAPIGKTVVSNEVAEEIRRRHAAAIVDSAIRKSA